MRKGRGRKSYCDLPGLSTPSPRAEASVTTPFEAIARQHNFPKDLPSREVATEVTSMLICTPASTLWLRRWMAASSAATSLDERSSICGVGPITVDPSQQVARIASSCRACKTKRPSVSLDRSPPFHVTPSALRIFGN